MIGQIDFEGDIVDVKQNILGEQTNIELFDDIVPKVDSEVPQLNLSSVGKYTTDGISGVYEIFNFHNLDN